MKNNTKRKQWNKGLTKETDERVRRQSEKVKGNKNMLGKKHSKMSRRIISEKHKGKKQSQETIKKRIMSRKGYKHSNETKINIGLGNKGKIRSTKLRKQWSNSHKGQVPWNKNKKMPQISGDKNPAKRPEVREKLRLNHPSKNKGYIPTRGMLNKHHTAKTKRKISKAKTGKKRTSQIWNKNLTKENDERVNNISKNTLGRKIIKETIDKMILTKKKKGTFKKHSKFMKARWANKEYKENQIRKWIKGNKLKPNKKEKILDKIIQTNFKNQFKLNVEGDIIINGKIPDWINCNRQKKVILFNGLYWHLWKSQEKNPNLTKELVEKTEREPYHEFGFKVLHIWEDELKNISELKQKIKKFVMRS